MIDRRLVTDFAFAVLIALPAILPAAPSPWSLHTPVGYPPPEAVEAVTPSPNSIEMAGASKWDRAQPERRS